MIASLIFFGPSVLGIVIAVVASLKCERNFSKIALTILALVLHGISSVLLFIGVRVGEAWSGYSRSHNMPLKYGFFGVAIIIAINLLIPVGNKNIITIQNVNYSRYIAIIFSVFVALFLLLAVINNLH